MNTQSEALRLAEALEKYDICASNDVMPDLDGVAAELRRLFELAYDQHTTIYGLRLSVLNLQHNNEVLMNALWKACGDDGQVVNDTIESQGELK